MVSMDVIENLALTFHPDRKRYCAKLAFSSGQGTCCLTKLGLCAPASSAVARRT